MPNQTGTKPKSGRVAMTYLINNARKWPGGAVSLTRTALHTMQPHFEGSGLTCEESPLHQRYGASFFVGLAVDNVACKTEVNMDVGVDGSKLL